MVIGEFSGELLRVDWSDAERLLSVQGLWCQEIVEGLQVIERAWIEARSRKRTRETRRPRRVERG